MTEPNEEDRKAASELYDEWFSRAFGDKRSEHDILAQFLAQFRAQARAEEAMRWKTQDPYAHHRTPAVCRAETIEECAKAAEDEIGRHVTLEDQRILAAIRALKEKRG